MSIYLLIYLISLVFAKDHKAYTNWWKQLWCKTAMVILGVKLNVKYEYEKENLPETYLTVCNHTTFMDPVVGLAVLNGMPVAKAEIAKYPLIGYAAKRTGIIWVERKSIQSRAAAKTAVEKALKNNRSVLLYPEGTLSYSPTKLRPFKKGAFYAAQNAEVPVLYCALFYETEKAYWQEENSLIKQFLMHFSVWHQKVHIHISKARKVISPDTNAIEAEKWIQKELNSIVDAAKLP